MSCNTQVRKPDQWWPLKQGAKMPYAWGDITWMLGKAGVSWGYFVGPDSCVDNPCKPQRNARSTNPIFNPLPGFQTVRQSGQLGNVAPYADFFSSIKTGDLPSVSWVVPTAGRSEHPGDELGNIATGQAWVTTRRQLDHAGTARAVGTHGDLPHVGRLGRLLRPRAAAEGGRVSATASVSPAS